MVCVDAEIRAIVSIQYRSYIGHKRSTVTYYAEQGPDQGSLPEVPKVKIKWFTPQQAKQLGNFSIVKLIKKIESGGECTVNCGGS